MRVVIVGGVAGGAACAARLRRLSEDLEIVMVEKGPYISFANCGLPYYLSGAIAQRGSLLITTKEQMHERFNIEVRLNTEVVKVQREQKMVELKSAQGSEELSYDVLILSPGSEPIVPPFARGLQHVYTLRSVPDADAIKQDLVGRHAHKVLVAGGGFIGLECAENLVEAGIEVTLIEGAPQVLLPLDFEMAQYVHLELKQHGVQLKLNTMLENLQPEADGKLKATFGGGQIEIFDGAVLAIGGRPLSTLAKDCGLLCNERGFIKVNDFMQTSDPAIYALGDAVELGEPILGGRGSMALAGPANKEARALTAHLAKNYLGLDLHLEGYKGALGASAVKVFTLEAASVGLNERVLKQKGRQCDAIWLHPMQHASYYPGAAPCNLKVVYDPDTFELLGAQAVGAEAVKRIEVMSAYLGKKGTIDDLAFHEQVYAPPFSSARDGINYAGCMLQNIRAGLVKTARFDELETRFKDAFKLDVRPSEMFAAASIPGFVNIPWGALRKRLNEIPKDRPIVVTCVVGISAYNACRILLQNGFSEVYDLSGGVQTWFTAQAKI